MRFLRCYSVTWRWKLLSDVVDGGPAALELLRGLLALEQSLRLGVERLELHLWEESSIDTGIG